MSFRKVKGTARSRIHARMQVEARWYSQGKKDESSIVHLRVNSQQGVVGNVPGVDSFYARQTEVQPRLIFLVEQGHKPSRGDVYIVSTTEGYTVDHLEPADGGTVTAVCSTLPETTLSDYAPPRGD